MRQRTALLLTLATLAAPQLLEAVDHQVSVGPGNAFSPATVNINVGDRVIWNRLGGTHNVVADDGSFNYTPEAGYVGMDAFLYRTSDGEKWSAVAAVTIYVTPVDGPDETRRAKI